MPERVRLEGITVRFGTFTALDDVSLSLRGGEVHALVGENGAGKSTLMKVLAGMLKPGAGRVLLDGPQGLQATAQPQAAVAMVHQHFQLVDSLTVAENLYLAEGGAAHGWFLRRRDIVARAGQRLERFRLRHLAATRVGDLGTGERQLIEIAKATARDAPVLVLDEPTASLGEEEADRLFALVRQLKAAGTAIVLIAHSLEEVLSVADRISVLRGGRLITTVARQDVDRARLVELIVGRRLNEDYPCERPGTGAVRLRAEGLLRDADGSSSALALQGGRITGVPTYVGADTDDLLATLAGARRTLSPLWVDGRTQARASLRSRVGAGVALVPGDALKEGVVPQLSILDNILLPNARGLSRFGILDRRKARRMAADTIAQLGIRASSPDARAGDLSGGNRQKVVLAKWLVSGAGVLLMNDPTKAVDVGARLDIYRLIDRAAAAGAAILLVSSDVDELIGMADTVQVLHQARRVAEHQRPIRKEALMQDVVGSRSSRGTPAVGVTAVPGHA
jgi:ribose transport system ATP-binding protein